MTASALLVFLAAAAIAAANGANDVSKGIATLVGSGVTDYRRAIAWGTLWTVVGGLAAVVVGKSMIATFGTGLLADGADPTYAAALATIAGAAGWVFLATRTGLPVSTTHAIVGSLAGVAAAAYGVEGVRWGALGTKIIAPLLLTPLVSLAVSIGLLRLFHRDRGAGRTAVDCLCAETRPSGALLATTGDTDVLELVSVVPAVTVWTGHSSACQSTAPRALRLTIDHLHWLTSGATSLARGLNDTPKIAALALAASALTVAPIAPGPIFVLVTLGMAAGGLIAGIRVTRVLAENVTPMDHHQGFLANLVTSLLVASGAVWGMPMSTTHVSVGAIIGTGATRGAGDLDLRTVREMLLAWVLTLPAAAAFGVASYVPLSTLGD